MLNRVASVICTLVLLTGFAAAQSFYGVGDVAAFREGRDKEFRNRVESPLLDADFEKFNGLSYYNSDPAYRVKAVYAEAKSEAYFLMPTTAGTSVKYIKIGELRFDIDGSSYVLNAYQSEAILTNEVWNKKFGHAFFIPFRDKTNGTATYGGGRYLYMTIPKAESTFLDFNLAFNPSCAYGSERYACPIPPKENSLEVEIPAGEKIFVYTKKH